MGNSFRLDDLLGQQSETKPPKQKRSTSEGFALDELLGPSTASPSAPAAPITDAPPNYPGAPASGTQGDVDLGKLPAAGSAPIVAPDGAPAPRRGIVDRLEDLLGGAGQATAAAAKGQAPVAGLYDENRETRTPLAIPDRRTPSDKLAGARRALDRTITQRPDETRVLPAGSPMAAADQAATATGLDEDARLRAQFTPKKWREIARKGMDLANRLHAEGKHDEAEDANKKAYNAQLIADGAQQADTFGAIALSSLLGIVSDPLAGQRRNLAEIDRDQSTFTPAEQTDQLGINLPAPTRRGFDPQKDLAAPLVGSLPVFIAGGAAGRTIAEVGAEALGGAEATGTRGMLARGLGRLAEEAETTGIYGPKQAGMAGAREAVENFSQNAGKLATRGATQGQVIGAVQAAREAQQTGDDPLVAAAGAVLTGAPLGVVGELAGGLASRALPLAGRTIDRAIGGVLHDFGEIGHLPEDHAPVPTDLVPAPVAGALEAARDVEGKLPIADMTAEGQHATIAKALNAVLNRKVTEEATADLLGDVDDVINATRRPILDPVPFDEARQAARAPGETVPDRLVEPGSALSPREPAPGEVNPPLRSQREIVDERMGLAETPTDQNNAVVQMERAKREAARLADEQVQAEQQARIEQAAAQRAVEKQGPLTLAQTLARAGRDAEAGEPLAADYAKAIKDFASVSARLKDAGENVPEKLRFDWQAAKRTLNDMRTKYGRFAGSAALVGLAAADAELTPDEEQHGGIRSATLAGLGLAVIHERLPVRIREAGRAMVDDLLRTHAAAGIKTEPMSAAHWFSMLADKAQLGIDHDRVQRTIGNAVNHDWTKMLTPEQVRAIFEEPAERQGLVSRGFTSRLRTFAETLPGKAWDQPRAAGDWIGKLKAGGSFSKAESGLVLPKLEELAASKTKVSRADVLRLIDESLPQVDRTTLAHVSGAHGNGPLSADDLIEPVTDVEAGLGRAWFREDVDEQIAARERKQGEIRDRIRESQEDLENEHDSAGQQAAEAHDEVLKTLERFSDQIDPNSVMQRISRIINEEVDSDGTHGAIDKAFDAAREDISYHDEVPEPEDQGWDFEDIENPREPNGEPWVKATSPNGTDYIAPTKWEAVAKGERKGEYDGGGHNPILPPQVTFERVPSKARLLVWEREGNNDRAYRANVKTLEPGETFEAAEDHMRHRGYGGADYTFERVPEGERRQWRALTPNPYGGEEPHVAYVESNERSREMTREQFVKSYIDNRWEPKVGESDVNELYDDIRRLADRAQEAQEIESRWYSATEDEQSHFYQEHSDLEDLEAEIEQLNEMRERAPARAEAPPPGEVTEARNPYQSPIAIESRGDPGYSTYQRIPGGTNYREMVNSWANPPKQLTSEAYGNHDYWTNKGVPNAIGHMRGEDHLLYDTPGLEGEKVAIPAIGEVPDDLRRKYIDVADVRGRRNRALRELAETDAAIEAFPPNQRDPNGNIAPEVHDLVNKWRTINNQVNDLAQREAEIAETIRDMRGSLLGENAEPRKALNILESQTSLSQHQATLKPSEYTPEDVPALREERDRIWHERSELGDTRREAMAQVAEMDESFYALIEKDGGRSAIRQKLESAGHAGEADTMYYNFYPSVLADDATFPETVKVLQQDPEWAKWIADYREKFAKVQGLEEQRQTLTDRANLLDHAINDAMREQPDVGIFGEIGNAQAFNAASAVIAWAEGDYSDLIWSDSANRIKNANLQRRPAKQWYDGMFGAAVKRAFGYAGFKVDIEHIFVNGEGHWRIRGTPEMREAIRKYGVPALAVLAMTATPDEAEAQGQGGSKSTMYGTFAGGVAAGAVLAAAATNKSLRRLIKENRELNRALMIDDLSGLSNQKAFLRARESVDRDPNTAWVTFDANRFKTYNDVHGHPEGDKVVQHFGRVIHEQMTKLGIADRSFRSGGDEFSVAVPKAQAADVLRAIEDASPMRKGAVEVSLTGAIGDTHGEADALLGKTKEANAEDDPTLARGWMPGAPKTERPEIDAKLAAEVNKALDKFGPTSPQATALVNRVRSGKIDPMTLIALSYIPVGLIGGALSGNTPDERRTNMILGGVAAALAAGASIAGPRVAAALRDVRVQRALGEDRSKAIEFMLMQDESLARRAKQDGRTPAAQLEHEREQYATTNTSEGMQAQADAQRAQELIDETDKPSFLYTRPHDIYSNPIGPALAELRKYPSAAAVGILGYAMTQSDNENVQRAGVPTMALAALHAIGSDRLLAGKDYLGTKLIDRLRQSSEGTAIVRAFNPDALLDPEVRNAILQFERDHAKGVARAAEYSGKMKKLGPTGDRAVSDILEGESWEDVAKLSNEQHDDILTAAAALKDEYDRLTQAQLDAGTLRPSQVLPNYGGPRRYAFYDAQVALAEHRTPGGAGRDARINGTRTRTLDIPLREAEDNLRMAQASGDAAKIKDAQDALDEAKVVQMSKRVERGEIREASYRAAVGIEKAHTNVASAKLFETIRNAPGAAHPEWLSAVNDLMAAKDMYRTATGTGDRDIAEMLQHEAAARLDEVVRRFRRSGGDYVALPDTPGLGALRGAVVKRDIAHSLEGFGAPGTFGKALRAWKELKTVFNVGTSVGNILSNVAALHVSAVPIWLQPKYLKDAVSDLHSYGEGTRALAEAGVLGVNETTARGEGEVGRGMQTREGLEELLDTTRPETQQVLRQEGITEGARAERARKSRVLRMAGGAAVGFLKGYDPENPEDAGIGAAIGAGVGAMFTGKTANAIRRFYGNEDNVARIAVFLRRRALGDTPEQATEAAINSLGNFRTRSPVLRGISQSVSPFVLYQAKAVPAFARAVVDHPWKYLSLMAAWGAMNELSKQEVGEVPESDIPVADRRSYGYFFPGFTQLPFGDERGNRAAVDMARYTPVSGLTTGAPPGSVPEAFSDDASALVTPGGPVIDASLRASNIDPFTRDPLLKRDRPVGENVQHAAKAVSDLVLPSSLGFHMDRLRADAANEDWTKFKNDLLGPLGAKPRYVRPGAVASDAVYTLRSSLRDMKQEFKKTLRANKDPERAQQLAKQYQQQVATALLNFTHRLGAPPPKEVVDEYLTHDPE